MLMRVPSRGLSAESRPGRLHCLAAAIVAVDGDRSVRHQCRRPDAAVGLPDLTRRVRARTRGLLRRAIGRRSDGPEADGLLSVLQQEQHSLRPVRLAHLHDRSLRDLLLPRARAPPGTGRRLRGKRVPESQLRPPPRSVDQGAADPLQDAQRVRAAERRARAPGRKASARSPSRSAIACCSRSTIRPIGSTA